MFPVFAFSIQNVASKDFLTSIKHQVQLTDGNVIIFAGTWSQIKVS